MCHAIGVNGVDRISGVDGSAREASQSFFLRWRIVIGCAHVLLEVLARHAPADQAGDCQHYRVQPLRCIGLVPGILSIA